MKLLYSRFRISLFTFALGLAAVYMWNGLSIGMSEVPVDLPKIESNDEIMVVFPTSASDIGVPGHYGDRTEQIFDGRDLSLYDTTEFSRECGFESGKDLKRCLSKRDAARRFIHEHWTKQRRGYIKIGFPCRDCSPVDHIFIEPDKNGRWIIVATLESNGPLRTSRGAKAVFRRPRQGRWDDGSSRMLSLIDEKGSEVEAF
ncbi:MAG TPA: hypothetical protein VGQ55_15210 [Pyrinomonadaceae bacterium]|nr:hypothetical protein [Pyrinomonadaceae bacterium]